MLRKGQVWIVDLFFGLLVFIAVLVIFFKSELNLSDSDDQAFDDIMFESKLVSDALLSQGYPSDWKETNVTDIGLTNDYVINETKLFRASNISYTLSKSKLRTKYDYYVFFESADGIMKVGEREGLGKPNVNSSNILEDEEPHNLISITRFVVFRNKPAKMVVYLWN